MQISDFPQINLKECERGPSLLNTVQRARKKMNIHFSERIEHIDDTAT